MCYGWWHGKDIVPWYRQEKLTQRWFPIPYFFRSIFPLTQVIYLLLYYPEFTLGELISMILWDINTINAIGDKFSTSMPIYQCAEPIIRTIMLFIWRRQWQPTPIPLLGKSHGRRSLVGCSRTRESLRVGHDWSDLATAAGLPGKTYTIDGYV